MKVVAGSASINLGKRVAEELNVDFAEPEFTKFPDGELRVQIPSFEDEVAVLIQTTYPNDKIIELFLLQDALREMNVKKIITVIPYFGYSRQDKIFNPGEAISARVMAKHISLYSDNAIVIDIHAESILSWFTVPVSHIHATVPISRWLEERGVNMVISPDKGGYTRARLVAEQLGAEFDYLQKTRLSGEEVIIRPKHLNVEGKKVAIVDDIISTGGTIARAAEQLRAQGAEKIYAVCTHGLFINNAIEKLESSVDEFAATDTIEGPYSKMTISKEISKAVANITSAHS